MTRMVLKSSWRKSNLREYFSELISVVVQMSQDCVPSNSRFLTFIGQYFTRVALLDRSLFPRRA